jgi:hypothetical protein
MPAMICPACGEARMRRRRRGFLERFVHAAVYFCPVCSHEAPVSQVAVYPGISRQARCPRCSNARLKQLDKRDHIEKLYRNPISRIQQWFGAPLLYCQFCRLQFYDFRPRKDASGE